MAEPNQATPLKRKNAQVETVVNPVAEFARVPNGGGPGPQDMSTPLRQKTQESADPRMPPQNMQTPLRVPVPEGQSQGISVAERAGPMAGLRREFFGLKESDYKSTLIVFALVLVFSSTYFYSALAPRVPSLISVYGKPSPLGSVVFAIAASLIYLFIKFFAKL